MIERYLTIYPSGKICWSDIRREPIYDSVYNGEEGLIMSDLKAVIGCHTLEMVRTVIPGIVMMIDERGKICKDPKPHNELASLFYRGYVPLPIDDIVGTAVFFALMPTEPIGEMDLFPLSPAQLQLVAARLDMTLAQLLEEVRKNA